MAVHLLCSHTATFSSVITHVCPPAKSWLPHSFSPCLGTHQFAPRTVNILTERRWIRCCDETIGKQGEMRTLETASCPPSSQMHSAYGISPSGIIRVPLASCYAQMKPHKGLELALIILEGTANNTFLKVKSVPTKNPGNTIQDVRKIILSI